MRLSNDWRQSDYQSCVCKVLLHVLSHLCHFCYSFVHFVNCILAVTFHFCSWQWTKEKKPLRSSTSARLINYWMHRHFHKEIMRRTLNHIQCHIIMSESWKNPNSANISHSKIKLNCYHSNYNAIRPHWTSLVNWSSIIWNINQRVCTFSVNHI